MLGTWGCLMVLGVTLMPLEVWASPVTLGLRETSVRGSSSPAAYLPGANPVGSRQQSLWAKPSWGITSQQTEARLSKGLGQCHPAS